jgi:hypothetical protein
VDQRNGGVTSRRKFMQLLGMLGIGGQFLLRPRDLIAAVNEAAGSLNPDPSWPEMTYRKLGRTGYRASRLIGHVASVLRLMARCFKSGHVIHSESGPQSGGDPTPATNITYAVSASACPAPTNQSPPLPGL